MKLDFRKRLWLEGHRPIVLLHEKVLGIPCFAYVEMTVQSYEMLVKNPALYKNAACHGKVILSGCGVPSESQKRFMEEYYKFDHTVPVEYDSKIKRAEAIVKTA